jgi:glyoxylase I family protein
MVVLVSCAATSLILPSRSRSSQCEIEASLRSAGLTFRGAELLRGGRQVEPLATGCGMSGACSFTMPHAAASRVDPHTFVKGVHGVRYQVKDVARSIEFYTQQLGFTLEHQQLPAFANVSLGEANILLSGPGASGSRPMPNGQEQEPGGWNRVVLRVSDLPACIDALKSAGFRFRNEMETGPGGRQIQIEDPDGNPIELFEPAR